MMGKKKKGPFTVEDLTNGIEALPQGTAEEKKLHDLMANALPFVNAREPLRYFS